MKSMWRFILSPMVLNAFSLRMAQYIVPKHRRRLANSMWRRIPSWLNNCPSCTMKTNIIKKITLYPFIDMMLGSVGYFFIYYYIGSSIYWVLCSIYIRFYILFT